MMIRIIWNLLLTFIIFYGLLFTEPDTTFGVPWDWGDTSEPPKSFWYWLFVLVLWITGRQFKKAGDKATAKRKKIRAKNKAKQEKHIDTQLEEAEKEIESGDVDEKLWKRAFVEADGDIQKQKAIYMKYRTK
tara:strand:- start:854 stop:1249 length:396 start_codon:yes stop_codon:yes gene_type:complete